MTASLYDSKLLPSGDRFDIYAPGSSALSLVVRGGAYFDAVRGIVSTQGATLALTASAENYVEMDDDGVVTSNTTSFTAGSTALYVVTTNATVVTGVEDYRGLGRPQSQQVMTVTGAIREDVDFVSLDHASVIIAATIAAPRRGRLLVIAHGGLGTTAHTVTCTAGDFDGTAAIATLNALEEALVLYGVSATRWLIVENLGGVVLS